MFTQPGDGAGHGIDGWRFIVAADGEEKEGDEEEAVIQDGVDSVDDEVVGASDIVQGMDLVDGLVVERQDVGRFDIGGFVFFEEEQLVSDQQQLIEDGLFLGADGRNRYGRVAHGCGEVQFMKEIRLGWMRFQAA